MRIMPGPDSNAVCSSVNVCCAVLCCLLFAPVAVQPSSSTLAHVGGISAMEVQGDMIATAGFSRRMGQVMADNLVKVFDCRYSMHVPLGMGIRAVTTLNS